MTGHEIILIEFVEAEMTLSCKNKNINNLKKNDTTEIFPSAVTQIPLLFCWQFEHLYPSEIFILYVWCTLWSGIFI